MTVASADRSPRWWQRGIGGLLIVAGLLAGLMIVVYNAEGSPHTWIKSGAGGVLAATIPVGIGVKMLQLPRRRGYLIGLCLGWLPGVAIGFDAVDSIVEPSRWLSGSLRGNHSIGDSRNSGIAGVVVAAIAIAIWAAFIYTYRHPPEETETGRSPRSPSLSSAHRHKS